MSGTKADVATKAAVDAFAAGRFVLVYKISEPSMSRPTGVMGGVGEQIEAIECQGWTLSEMTAAESKSVSRERTSVVCVFRRR
ncbi:hypothetical protein [Streptomyces sp. RTGN2]|uniref:hypothetical protein n=1 Tax=unclassified Streptomyces TaxID=2593676 RepID=UPI0025539BE8|nr:hypothetical protein [Streptomyces sp. RTGN2]